MTGVELVAGAAVGYLVRKLRRVAGRADTEVDRALDAGMDAVHELVTTKLSADPSLAMLAEQAPADQVSDRTVRRVTDAVADAAETDADFAEQLNQLVQDLQHQEAAAGSGGSVQQHAQASGHGRVYQAGRDQTINER